ncbi:MAG: hypothetical protein FWC50_04530 [Planctomycetaceae bacterium]|nr:hypothetical protein [Planctomycetaceae bacterium]
MTDFLQRHQQVAETLENVLLQLDTTQSQVDVLERQLHEITTQLDQSRKTVESARTILNEAMASEELNSKHIHQEVAKTLDEMFRQMSSIVSSAREKMQQEASAEKQIIAQETNEKNELLELLLKPEHDNALKEPALHSEKSEKEVEQGVVPHKPIMPKTPAPPESEVLTADEARERIMESLDDLNTAMSRLEEEEEETDETLVNELLKSTSSSFVADGLIP